MYLDPLYLKITFTFGNLFFFLLLRKIKSIRETEWSGHKVKIQFTKNMKCIIEHWLCPQFPDVGCSIYNENLMLTGPWF